MREIKFRAWDVENKKTFIPYSITFQKREGLIPRKLVKGDLIKVKNHILMQYTGLNDKNGVEIYEGDVVGLNYGIPPMVDRLIIKYVDDSIIADVSVSGWWMQNVRPNGCSSSLCKTYEDDIEIIGNIYENPELINKL